MEVINSLFNLFTDKTKALSFKAIISFFVLVLIIFIDNTLSFSYYYNTQNKIEQIGKLNKMIADDALDVDEKTELVNLRRQIIERRTWKDKTWDFITKIEFKSNQGIVVNNGEINSDLGLERSYLIHFITSSWTWLILMIVVFVMAFVGKYISILERLFTVLFFELILSGCAFIFTKAFSYIPIIFGSPTYNYVLNALLCLGIVVGFYFIVGSAHSYEFEEGRKYD